MIDEEKEAIDHFANYEVEIIKEGVGVCGVHHCNLWQVQKKFYQLREVLKVEKKKLSTSLLPSMSKWEKDRRLVGYGASPEYGTDVTKPQEVDYFEKLRLQKALILEKMSSLNIIIAMN